MWWCSQEVPHVPKQKNHNVITFPIQYEKMKKPKPPMIGTVPPLLATPYPGTLQLTTV